MQNPVSSGVERDVTDDAVPAAEKHEVAFAKARDGWSDCIAGVRRVSKPGRRIYRGRGDLPRVSEYLWNQDGSMPEMEPIKVSNRDNRERSPCAVLKALHDLHRAKT